MTTKVVIIGGVAGGATAAARLTRLSNQLDITVIERGKDVSFANCGLPYHIGRQIRQRSALKLHTPQSLRDILRVTRVLTQTEAISIDRKRRVVVAKDLRTGVESEYPYDKLIVSPGASPFVPPSILGVKDPRIRTLRNLTDMDSIDAVVHSKQIHNVAVIGAGFIGIEMAEQLQRVGECVTIVDISKTVLPQADPEIGEFLHEPLEKRGIKLHLGSKLLKFDVSSPNRVIVVTEAAEIPVDYVVLCIGVMPETKLAKDCGLDVAPRGQIIVNDFMQTSDPNIYAVGDAVETRDMVFPDRRAWVALGNVANMQARIAADHAVTGRSIPYPGSVGSAIVRAFDRALAITGWSEKRLKAAGIPYKSTTITALHHAGYYPGAEPITMKITFDPETGRIYGGQAVGMYGVDKRIDVIAMAIQGKLTVEDISLSQLTYSPPYGSARDVVNVAGLSGRNMQDGLVKPQYTSHDSKKVLLDCRTCDNAKEGDIPGAIHIPHNQVQRLAHKKLNKNDHYITICDWGKTGYFANRQLMQQGYNVTNLTGGWRVEKMRDLAAKPTSPSSKSKL